MLTFMSIRPRRLLWIWVSSGFKFNSYSVELWFVLLSLIYFLLFPSTVDQELLRQNLNPHFLNSQEREGRRSVPGAENNAAAAGRATPGGPSATSSGPGSSGRTSQNQPNIPHMAFQFHQHNHQHQHTHTHHFTPFLHPTATAPPLVRCSAEHLCHTANSSVAGMWTVFMCLTSFNPYDAFCLSVW